MDVVENLSMLINPSNNIVKSEVVGAANATCKLSYSPEITMGFNDKLFDKYQERSKVMELNAIKFHNCVRTDEFDNQVLFVSLLLMGNLSS